MLRRISVFCGSNLGKNRSYRQAAQAVGRLLAQHNIELVYGGANVGLMGALADVCLEEGGHVIGAMPHTLVEKEIAHAGLSELHVVDSMHARKFLMADFSDAFIALPGGYGTWEEFCEVLTWSQLGIQLKACALLNVDGYYDPLLAMADRAASEGFLQHVHRDMLLSDDNPAHLLDRLIGYSTSFVEKWLQGQGR